MGMPPRKWVGYGLLIAGLLLFFDTVTFLKTNWSPLYIPLSVSTELDVAYLLSAAGLLTLLAPVLLRIVGSYAPDASVKTGESYPHQSVEVRLRRRLPLRSKHSSLPDRATVGGAMMLLLLIPMFLLVNGWNPRARGIYVRITPAHHIEPDEDCLEGPIVVEVRGHYSSAHLLLKGKDISQEGLGPALRAELARRAHWEVFVEGDDSVPHGDVMFAVDAIHSLRAKAVILTPKLTEQISGFGCSP
jgi:biopolymer transport protein ExbD